MSTEIGLALLGLALTVAFGLAAFFISKTVRNRRQSQSQKVGSGGIGIQSGRNTRIGTPGD